MWVNSSQVWQKSQMNKTCERANPNQEGLNEIQPPTCERQSQSADGFKAPGSSGTHAGNPGGLHILAAF